MFEGPRGKKMMIEQGYVPATCTLDEKVAGPLIHSETAAGHDVCAGCHENRDVCKGRRRTRTEAELDALVERVRRA